MKQNPSNVEILDIVKDNISLTKAQFNMTKVLKTTLTSLGESVMELQDRVTFLMLEIDKLKYGDEWEKMESQAIKIREDMKNEQ